MSRILIAVSLLVAFVGSAMAAEVRLGPETALTPPGPLSPAESVKGPPAVASNGNDFLAIWADYRRGRESDLYASRIGRDGQSTEPAGHRIAAAAYSGLIASAGGDYLVAYGGSYVNGPLMTQRLDEDGKPLTTPRIHPGLSAQTLSPLFLTTHGENYLLVASDGSADVGDGYTWQATGLLLDRDGVPLRTLWVNGRVPIAVGVHNGNYVVVDIPFGSAAPIPVLRTISDSGDATSTPLPGIGDQLAVAAFSPDRILIAWKNANNEFTFLLTGYDGHLVSGPTFIAKDPYGGLAAYWNGSEFEVAYSRSRAGVSIIRVDDSDGTILDRTPFILTSRGYYPAFAAGGGMRIIVWDAVAASKALITIPEPSNRIMARTFSSFDSILTRPDQGNLISWSGIAQVDVKVARTGEHEIAVWSDRTDRIFASVNGVPISINGVPVLIGPRQSGGFVDLPAVGSSNNNFLISWHDGSGPMLAQRVAFDGRVLDNPPIVLSANADPLYDPNSDLPKAATSIASDGSTYLVVWSNVKAPHSQIVAARVERDGGMPALAVLSGTADTAEPHAPQVSWTGNKFLVNYTFLNLAYCSQPVYCPTQPAGMGIAALDATGQLLPVSPRLLPYLGPGYTDDYQPVRMASGAGMVTFVFGGGFVVAETMTDGLQPIGRIVLSSSSSYAEGLCATPPAIGWDGAEFVVAWIDACRSVVRAVRLNQFGDPLEEPFDVAADVPELYSDGYSFGPSIVPTPDGVAIVYSRNDVANGDAPRAFERSLARLPPSLPRRRVVTH
ncbi:MAG TPA: hypothetical protein VNN08_13855 [Thermoanaerobaculia bacterium]|nr:hypothetical protein [Thermoanaerobaculia bacterium]